MTRFGKRVSVLTELNIAYPVGRDGARFSAQLPSAALAAVDTSQLRFFVIQDDAGHRYPAMIDHAAPLACDPETSGISGVVVAGW